MSKATPPQKLLAWQYERMLQWVAVGVVHGETYLIPLMEILEQGLAEARRGDPLERARQWAKQTMVE